jgi:hypothetical protein
MRCYLFSWLTQQIQKSGVGGDKRQWPGAGAEGWPAPALASWGPGVGDPRRRRKGATSRRWRPDPSARDQGGAAVGPEAAGWRRTGGVGGSLGSRVASLKGTGGGDPRPAGRLLAGGVCAASLKGTGREAVAPPASGLGEQRQRARVARVGRGGGRGVVRSEECV